LVPASQLRNSFPSKIANIEAMAMAPKPPTLMIAVGLGRVGEAQDEDSLDREQDGNGDGDICTEAILAIISHLHRSGPSAVRDLRRYIGALEEMCRAFMEKDNDALAEAATEACQALRDIGD
jgi:hypothetical protein